MNIGDPVFVKTKPPQIMLEYMRDPKSGDLLKIRTCDFIPGLVIERAGRRYQLQADGSQRRI